MDEVLLDRLPDDVLCNIISLLFFDEAVRTSVLSKRWKALWKKLSILNFDATHMMGKPKSILKKKCILMRVDPNSAEKHVWKYGEIVKSTIRSHLTDLTSCRFYHFLRPSATTNLEDLVKLLVEKNKRLSSLILECSCACFLQTMYFQRGIFSNLCSLELINYAFTKSASSAFECCEKLKTLKLEKIRMKDITIDCILKNCLALEKFSLIESRGFNKLKIQNSSLRVLELGWLMVCEIDVYVENLQIVVLDSIICPIKYFKIYSQDIRVFRYYYSSHARSNFPQRYLLKTGDVLVRCYPLFESQPTNIFGNLSTLSIELDFNNIKECTALAYMLRSCYNLNTLEITIPVLGASYPSDISDDDSLPFPKSMFLERNQIYNCLQKQEVKFVKHLITKANMVEKLYVICDSFIMKEATSLLSLTRASVNLSIILKSERRESRLNRFFSQLDHIVIC